MQPHYPNSRAIWRAARDVAKTQARVRNIDSGLLIRGFVFDRFLARVFALPGGQWVLKGGNAVLTRVHDARTTKDLDLLADLEDLNHGCKGASRRPATRCCRVQSVSRRVLRSNSSTDVRHRHRYWVSHDYGGRCSGSSVAFVWCARSKGPPVPHRGSHRGQGRGNSEHVRSRRR